MPERSRLISLFRVSAGTGKSSKSAFGTGRIGHGLRKGMFRRCGQHLPALGTGTVMAGIGVGIFMFANRVGVLPARNKSKAAAHRKHGTQS